MLSLKETICITASATPCRFTRLRRGWFLEVTACTTPSVCSLSVSSSSGLAGVGGSDPELGSQGLVAVVALIDKANCAANDFLPSTCLFSLPGLVFMRSEF